MLRHMLSPATRRVDVHGTYCRRTAHIVAGDSIFPVLWHIIYCCPCHVLSPIVTYCRRRQYIPGFTAHIVALRHILSPIVTYCRPSSHIVTHRHILSPIVTYCHPSSHILAHHHILSPIVKYCRPSSHIVAGDNIYRYLTVV